MDRFTQITKDGTEVYWARVPQAPGPFGLNQANGASFQIVGQHIGEAHSPVAALAMNLLVERIKAGGILPPPKDLARDAWAAAEAFFNIGREHEHITKTPSTTVLEQALPLEKEPHAVN